MQGKAAKKILLITHFLPPSHTAGTEQYTLALGKALLHRGSDVTILCAEDWDQGKKYWNGVTHEILEGVPVLRIHLNWLKAASANQILYDSKPVEKWLDRFLAENKFDVVHVISTYSLGVGVLRSAKRANIPLVLTLMDFWFLCPSLQLLRSNEELCDGNTTPWQCEACLMAGSRIFQKAKNIALPESVNSRFWDALSHVNLFTKQRGFRGMLLNMEQRKKVMRETFALPDLVISPSKIVQTMFAKNMDRVVELLPYHHDLSWLKGYNGRANSDTVRVGYLGQIHTVKGVHLLVDAFVRAGIEKQACLDIWGDYSKNPQYVQRLSDLARNNRSITLRGGYEREQLGGIMANMDVIVVPSIWYENAPLVIQEAFASRTPVITTNLGSMSEAVTHEVNGLLFERNNVDELAQLLRRVVSEAGLLEKLTAGIPPVRNFQDETLEIEMLYSHLIIEEKLMTV